jgi:hypothetical protein
MKRLWLVVLVMLGVWVSSTQVFAAQSNSTNYQVNEAQFGPGGTLNSTSPNYKARQNLGSTGSGFTSSTTYGANAGFLTPETPFLEMTVTAGNINLGNLSSGSTATGTSTFSIRAYLDSGYSVLTMSDPPKNESGSALNNLASPTASAVGAEQFGINLVQNLTSCPTPAPANFGGDPVLVPSSTFANGQAATGYNTCGLFKYVKGDTIAQNNGRGWGQTNYTISYMVNINATSKAGQYDMVQDLVAVVTY